MLIHSDFCSECVGLLQELYRASLNSFETSSPTSRLAHWIQLSHTLPYTQQHTSCDRPSHQQCTYRTCFNCAASLACGFRT